jgi:murein DD-endopeptidase MepM/ murein hydrolase activator NlpD
MVFKKKFSILFIPHQKGKIREKKVSVPFLIFLLIDLVILFGFNLFLSLDVSTRALEKLKLSRLEKENNYLEAKLGDLNSAISTLKEQMAELIEKEKNVRMVFGLPEVDAQIRELGVGGPMPSQMVNVGPEVEQAEMAESDLEKLLRQARFEKENFEIIYTSLSQRKKFLDHTPAIMPTQGYLSCGFGTRIDPFTGMKQLHLGVDLAADVGTPVYATADGVVSSVERDRGLGKVVKINHLYGYLTVYGHLSQIKAKNWQYVKRGEMIGTVGNTGLTTGPHLHYEVHYQGQPQNPLRYFLNSDYLVD